MKTDYLNIFLIVGATLTGVIACSSSGDDPNVNNSELAGDPNGSIEEQCAFFDAKFNACVAPREECYNSLYSACPLTDECDDISDYYDNDFCYDYWCQGDVECEELERLCDEARQECQSMNYQYILEEGRTCYWVGTLQNTECAAVYADWISCIAREAEDITCEEGKSDDVGHEEICQFEYGVAFSCVENCQECFED